jgi:hypothetical protein
MKICSKCKIEKHVNDFQKCKSNKDGLQKTCKICRKEKSIKDKNKISSYQKSRYLKNKNTLLKNAKTYRDKNKEKISLYKKQYRIKNVKTIKNKEKKYREANKKTLQKRKKVYRIKNKESINSYFLAKYKNDYNYKISHLVRNRINKVVKQNTKSDSTFKLLGCAIDFLREHLEKQFKEGMTWDNYGKGWHIDHIKPCAAFDLTDPEQQKECFHYSNLQPLWAEENLSKGAKILCHTQTEELKK